VEHPVIGSRLALGPPWRLSDTPAAIRRLSPCLGQLLGMPDEEIEELVRDGVVA
jgi:hypothetical protein